MSDAATQLDDSGRAADSSFSEREAGRGEEGCQAATWIEIRLEDGAGRPVPGALYRVVLPDGRQIEGRLGEDGTAGVEGIDPGDCEVTFPELDGDAWTPGAPTG